MIVDSPINAAVNVAIVGAAFALTIAVLQDPKHGGQ